MQIAWFKTSALILRTYEFEKYYYKYYPLLLNIVGAGSI